MSGQSEITLKTYFDRHRKSYEGRPEWEWEDEGKYYAVADYHSSFGEFTEADRKFAAEAGIEDILACVEADNE